MASHQRGWQFQSIQNALCADHISFNTAFNRETFLDGARRLLKRFPEKLPGRPLDQIEDRSDVLPVPLTDRFDSFRNAPKQRGRIVWNHRWEWDKQPAVFLAALVALHREGFDFELAMLGSGGGRDKAAFREEAKLLQDHIVQWGEADAAAYAECIRSADIGVSAALHDFQGLAMLELAQAGAIVVLPRRVAYPKVLPGGCFYEGSESDPDVDATQLKAVLADLLTGDRPPPNDPKKLPTWDHLRESYQAHIEQLSTE